MWVATSDIELKFEPCDFCYGCSKLLYKENNFLVMDINTQVDARMYGTIIRRL